MPVLTEKQTQQLAEATYECVEETLAPLRDRVAALEFQNQQLQLRLDAAERSYADLEEHANELEQRAAVHYAGTFQQGSSYSVGALLTKAGGLWLATKETSAAPGTDPAAWRLIVKSGGA